MQILLVGTIENVWRTVLRTYILMLRCKGLSKNFNLFFLQSVTKKIFKLYAKSKPGRVAEIILMSSLSGFSSGWLEKIVYWINLFFIIIN